MRRLAFASLVFVCAACAQVKTKVYEKPGSCFKTYHLATGRVLTSRGLIEDPTVNSIMKGAVAAEMNQAKIAETDKGAELEIRFMGGNSAGLQTDDLGAGDIAMWDIGGPQGIPGRTYKKSDLVIAALDTRSNRTFWAARCSDKFGDPNRLQERIQKAVAKAFAKFPKKVACGK
jgi:Domain of unknown function (DUF4136)